MRGKRLWLAAALLAPAILAAGCVKQAVMLQKGKDCPYKVYVILGFHANMYHSWRGDTPDEAGFGTDIRIVREIIRMLDEANARGLDARGYWEGENLFTWEDIVRKNAPDIIEDIRRRVDDGLDEVAPAPYSNTVFSGVTEEEMRAVLRWSITNPRGSGVKDLFGDYAPLLRPQEGMYATGQIPILKEEGIEGLILAYSSYPFTTFTNFVAPLPPEQRYNPTWMRDADGGDKILLFPCVSAGDVVDFISLERWMLDLREMQVSGEVNRDMVIHFNFDADAETWLPMLGEALGFIPNAGGLPEYIKYVNKYDWAEFSTPGEYVASHEPVGEVMIRQDLADGAWDGYYSWFEKYPSHVIWTALEKSRLYAAWKRALKGENDQKSVDELMEDKDSGFSLRVAGLSTTHFGMSTPMVNEERQAAAMDIVDRAQAVEKKALAAEAGERKDHEAPPETLYSFLIKDHRTEGERTFSLNRLPVILPETSSGLCLMDGSGEKRSYSLVNLEELPDGRLAAELLVPLELAPLEEVRLRLNRTRSLDSAPAGLSSRPVYRDRLKNGRVEIIFDEQTGISHLGLDGVEIGGPDFLTPFITYRSEKKPATYEGKGWKIESESGETWQDLERTRLTASIPFDTPDGGACVALEVEFTAVKDKPWLIADVSVDYPYTTKRDLLHTMQQKLRRYLDLRWVEVAPFELRPALDSDLADPVRVWKHNWLGVTSYYDVDYADINRKNAELDSFNHQVTAGWVAVTDKKKGLLLSQSAEALSSCAFCPMRTRMEGSAQTLRLNPFGSYHGEQMDYSHMGGNGLGTDITMIAGPALRPNGPSYNGMKEEFSLMLAPYAGDAPPEELQAEAMAFFHPPAALYLKTPEGVEASVKEDVEAAVHEARRRGRLSDPGPLPAPLAFLVNPTEEAAHVVWDEPEDPRVEGYEVQYRAAGEPEWKSETAGRDRRLQVADLENGRKYEFRARSVGTGKQSEWTESQICEIGPVPEGGILDIASGASPKLALKTLYYMNVHFLTTPKKP